MADPLFADPLTQYSVIGDMAANHWTTGGYIANSPDGAAHTVWQVQSNASIVHGIDAFDFERPSTGTARRVYFSSLPANTGQLPSIQEARNPTGATLASVKVETTGRLAIYNDAGQFVQATTLPVITAEGWWHVETLFLTGTLNVTVMVRVEGVEVLNVSFGLVTFDASDLAPINMTLITSVALEGKRDGIGAGPAISAKDFIIWIGNNWQGPAHVVAM